MPEMTWRELTPATWADFEAVMGENGGARGCWCMHWRLPFKEWQQGRGEGNRAAMRERAEEDPPPGVVCYLGEEPVGWVGVGERSEYPRMQRSPVTKLVDETPAWVFGCLYVRKGYREQGLLEPMIGAGCEFAARWGQETVEAYPVEPAEGKKAGADNAMTGIASSFSRAGFEEVARRKHDRPVMRLELTGIPTGTRKEGSNG
jgi:hypothetical protein